MLNVGLYNVMVRIVMVGIVEWLGLLKCLLVVRKMVRMYGWYGNKFGKLGDLESEHWRSSPAKS